jgi:hypothetical protein
MPKSEAQLSQEVVRVRECWGEADLMQPHPATYFLRLCLARDGRGSNRSTGQA